MNEALARLKKVFPKHHVVITLFPGGGMLDVNACEECGSRESYSRTWRDKNALSIDDAIDYILNEMKE